MKFKVWMGFLVLSLASTNLSAEETLAEEEIEIQKQETEADTEKFKKQTKDDLLRKPVRDKRKEIGKDLRKKIQWKKLF